MAGVRHPGIAAETVPSHRVYVDIVDIGNTDRPATWYSSSLKGPAFGRASTGTMSKDTGVDPSGISRYKVGALWPKVPLQKDMPKAGVPGTRMSHGRDSSTVSAASYW